MHAGALSLTCPLTLKTRNLGYENRVKVVKHDFLNLKSCNGDKEGLTKTLREGGQRDRCKIAWTSENHGDDQNTDA